MESKKRGQPNGPKNTNWRHGGFSDYMSEGDADWIDQRKTLYINAYPHLDQPAMIDLLDNYLRLLMQINRMWANMPNLKEEQQGSALERLMRLSRSCSLLGARMGLTYTSQRKQVLEQDDGSMVVKLPEEILAEMTKK